MTTYLFITQQPPYNPQDVHDGKWGKWSCSKSAKKGDCALVYITKGGGIAFEWEIVSDAEYEPGERWSYGCKVAPLRRINPPIRIEELRDSFSREEWAPPFTNFRGMRSIMLKDSVADRIRALRKNDQQDADMRIQKREQEFVEGEKRAQRTSERDPKLRAGPSK